MTVFVQKSYSLYAVYLLYRNEVTEFLAGFPILYTGFIYE